MLCLYAFMYLKRLHALQVWICLCGINQMVRHKLQCFIACLNVAVVVVCWSTSTFFLFPSLFFCLSFLYNLSFFILFLLSFILSLSISRASDLESEERLSDLADGEELSRQKEKEEKEERKKDWEDADTGFFFPEITTAQERRRKRESSVSFGKEARRWRKR